MKAEEIETLESYFKTENKYWNEYVFVMLCEVIKQGQFENHETPLQIFNTSIDNFTELHEKPFKAVQILMEEMDKQKLNPTQKLFIYEWVCKYLKQSEFEGIDLVPIKNLLKSQRENLKAESQPLKPLTKNIRDTLKEMMQKELESLPDTLKTLEPVQRLNILCKLIPFVLPKVESIHHEQGEPLENRFNGFNL